MRNQQETDIIQGRSEKDYFSRREIETKADPFLFFNPIFILENTVSGFVFEYTRKDLVTAEKAFFHTNILKLLLLQRWLHTAVTAKKCQPGQAEYFLSFSCHSA